MRSLVAVVAMVLALAACGGQRADPRRAPAENEGLGAITAITMQKTACYGTCPDYEVWFTADGRARYSGGNYAPLHGRFSGAFDFASLAQWIATQHPETLPDEYGSAQIDAQAVNLQIDYGARRVRVTGISEGSASLRLEGILLALDGVTSRIRWRRDDAATAFLGTFRGDVNLNVIADSAGRLTAYATPEHCSRYRIAASAERGAVRLRCDGRTSVLRTAGDDVQAEGNVIPPGRYARVNPYTASAERGWYREPRATERPR